MIELSEQDVKNICKWLQILENMLEAKKKEVSDQLNDPESYTQFKKPFTVYETTVNLLQGVKKAKDSLLVRVGVP